jgi:predicted transcriptional regulator
MNGESSPLDHIEFLARSPHRVRVLAELAAGASTRQELREWTEVSQPTLTRILGSFQDRGWLSKRGQQYTLTPFGVLLAEEFAALHETVEAMQRLQSLAPFLPLAEMDFDIRLFGEARITTPHPPDILAHARRAEALASEASHIRSLTANFYPDQLAKTYDLVVGGDQTQEAIASGAALDGLFAQAGAVDLARELLESGSMTVYRFDGEVPVGYALFDERAVVFPYDEHQRECGLIETENATVRSWVVEQLDAYQKEAERLSVDDLPD